MDSVDKAVEKERLAQALRDGDTATFEEAAHRVNEQLSADTTKAVADLHALAAAVPVILCAAPDCPNPAGPEGFCTDHEDLAKAAREMVAEGLQMRRQAESMDALRKIARKVVNTERRERWHRQNDAKQKRKRMAAASRRKQR